MTTRSREPVDGFITANPHPKFAALFGFQVDRELWDKGNGYGHLFLKVKNNGRVIGEADFPHHPNDFHCDNVDVLRKYQRRGIGTALFVLAEALTGRTLQPFWSGDEWQSEAARRLWEQPNRPFGPQ